MQCALYELHIYVVHLYCYTAEYMILVAIVGCTQSARLNLDTTVVLTNAARHYNTEQDTALHCTSLH